LRRGFGKHLPVCDKKAIEINRADVAELVDARDLKSHCVTEATRNSCLTAADLPAEVGGNPASLSNIISPSLMPVQREDGMYQLGWHDDAAGPFPTRNFAIAVIGKEAPYASAA
jgi:hypothetical protein